MEYSAKQLYVLQELDWKIAAGEEGLAQVRARLADDSAIVAVKATIQRVETDLADFAEDERVAPEGGFDPGGTLQFEEIGVVDAGQQEGIGPLGGKALVDRFGHA